MIAKGCRCLAYDSVKVRKVIRNAIGITQVKMQ